ncbi:RidA family protein [Variovorax sp. HJSM1_2]|uniref:RidA family protein n=1 Tax=Variovorax sp. HJSM1_2 TaxID=3366263 RepID=UPI003BEC1D45
MAGDQANKVQAVGVDTLAAPGGHYSHACVGAGLVFISGQLPITPNGVRLVDASFEVQTLQVLANVEAALLASGSNIQQLLQLRVYVDDIANWPLFNTLYAAWAGAARPARAVVPTGPLHFGLKLEVEAIALALPAP